VDITVSFFQLDIYGDLEPDSCHLGDYAKLSSAGPIYVQHLPRVPDIITV
jgi:hypothetical protein